MYMFLYMTPTDIHANIRLQAAWLILEIIQVQHMNF